MKRFIPLIILIALALIVYFSDVMKWFSFETLQAYHTTFRSWVEHHFFLVSLAYIGIYIAIAAFSLPVASYYSIFGGYLFPQPYCTIYVVIGATIGATILFSICKTALGSSLLDKVKTFLTKLEKGFSQGAVGYLLFLRFVPIFPFWLVNIAPAFFNVRLVTFAWTTFVGIIPGAFVFTQAGRGLESLLESNEPFTLQGILTPEMKLALAAIGILALLPFVIKKTITKFKSQ